MASKKDKSVKKDGNSSDYSNKKFPNVTMPKLGKSKNKKGKC